MSNIRLGAFWMILAGFCFTAMLICVRYLDARYSSVEVVFFRSLIGLVFIIPPLIEHGLAGLKTNRFPMHISRASFSLLAMATYYYAVPFVPLANVTTYAFIIPLVVTLGAWLFLKEVVDVPRWIATLVGFSGALIVLRPGAQPIDFAIFMIFLSILFYAGSWISMKLLSSTESASVIVFYQNLLIVPLALIPMLLAGLIPAPADGSWLSGVDQLAWKTPTFTDFLWLAGVGLFGSAAHFCQAKSFGSADASAVMPFDFVRLPFSVFCAWVLFQETTDIWTWVGAVIIFGATYYITWHESRIKKRAAG